MGPPVDDGEADGARASGTRGGPRLEEEEMDEDEDEEGVYL